MSETHEQKQARMVEFLKSIDSELFIVTEMLGRKIAEWNTHQGFWPADDNPIRQDPTWKLGRLMLMVTELAEAAEGIRKPGPDQHCPEFTAEEVEMADAIIRILDHCGKNKLRLKGALVAKLVFNLSRPHRHGKLA